MSETPATTTAPTSARAPRVACVVVSFNGAPWIADCLNALRASTVPLRVIVVDNASSDATCEIVDGFAEVTMIREPKNLGFGRANNAGIARALADGADHVFLLNQDTVLAPDAVEHLEREAALNPKLGILCPLQLDGEGESLDPTFLRYYVAPHVPGYLSDALTRHPVAGHYLAEALPAAAWLVTREFLETVGGFDPLFFLYCEDDDLCARAHHHGFDIALVPAATFRHLRGFHVKTAQPWLKQLRRRGSRLRSQIVCDIKRPSAGPLRHLWYVLGAHLFGGAQQLLVHFNWREAAAELAALLRVLPQLPRIRRHRAVCLRRGPHWIALSATGVVGGDPDATVTPTPHTAPAPLGAPMDAREASFPTRPPQQ
ncbi:glycosyltransferase family 2 protein [Roseateles chitosanitabidus]|uniref:glycosyltransferase family 2 protein n=1 Tax=Roseateles chitosanitabidus TaxID=65048 RepID=UPI00083510BA|nr:glycosyltransferase family 2 protein [Roseateles chitosanitabidus]